MIIKAGRIPRPGETVIGGSFHTGPGGKGANQAVAASRAGASVHFVGRLGADGLGNEALQKLKAEGVIADHVVLDSDAPTGTAWIIVDDGGENSIVVASGANARLTPQDVSLAEHVIAQADMLLLQLESPLPAIERAIEIAVDNDVRIMLNPAPAMRLSNELLSRVSVITPNEIEAEMLTGIKITGEAHLQAAADALHRFGIGTVILTLGAKGAFASGKEGSFLSPAFPVTAIDTTAAGDVFNGCLAAFLDGSRSIRESVRMSAAAAALSVTKLGAQESAPQWTAIEEFLHEHPEPQSINT
jgi:ribokinase